MKKIILMIISVMIAVIWSVTIYYAMRSRQEPRDASNSTSQTTVQSTSATSLAQSSQTTAKPVETTARPEPSQTTQTEPSQTTEQTAQPPVYEEVSLEELQKHRVNETGQIYILMFHGFIADELAGTYSDREYSMTQTMFRETLKILYDMDYRPITMDEFLRGHIDVPLGKIPIVLTFDDGRSGQFNLIKKDGELVADPKSAVGIWMDFNKQYPDFGLKGTFYVNLGVRTFEGEGTLAQRLKYMIDLGFEIGNHTYTHEALRLITKKEDVIYQMGKNQEVMESLVPGYKFSSLALPFGEDVRLDELKDLVVSGDYNGTSYDHLGVLDCKWRPSYSPFSVNFNARSIFRVRADGLDPVPCDMSDWMFKNLTTKRGQYISDGDPYTITVPESLAKDVAQEAVGDKKIITYYLD